MGQYDNDFELTDNVFDPLHDATENSSAIPDIEDAVDSTGLSSTNSLHMTSY